MMKQNNIFKLIISFLFITALLSCSKDDSSQTQTVLDTGFEFGMEDQAGNDLLDPDNPEGFKESEIKLFYLIEGNKTEVFDGSKDHPRNFFIYSHENQYRMAVFANSNPDQENTVTHIQWSEQDTDTLTTKIRRAENLTVLQKAWLNGELIWPTEANPTKYVELVK